jgi:hypothetical protein
LFTEDATLSLPDPPTGLEPTVVHRGNTAIRRAVSAVAAAARTQHAVVGEVYTQHADVTRGRISCVAHHWNERESQLTDVVWHVRYDDVYAQTPAGWRIRSRALTIDAIETRPARRLRQDET